MIIFLFIAKPFNADFDGDEMNVHICQSLDSTAELQELMLLNQHIITPGNCKPCLGLVQDCMSSMYCLTGDGVEFDKGKLTLI